MYYCCSNVRRLATGYEKSTQQINNTFKKLNISNIVCFCKIIRFRFNKLTRHLLFQSYKYIYNIEKQRKFCTFVISMKSADERSQISY